MKKTRKFVDSIIEQCKENEHVEYRLFSIDPVMAMLVLEIVLETVKLANSCVELHSLKYTVESCKSPNMLQRGLLIRIVNKSFPHNASLTKAVTSAIIKEGADLSNNDIEEMLNEHLQDD